MRRDINKGVWFQSLVSGAWYTKAKEAGDIKVIKVDGHLYEKTESLKVENEELKDLIRKMRTQNN